MDSTGKYQYIKPCSNNLFIVGESLRGGPFLKYGVVDNAGRIIIPLSFISIFDEIGRYFRVRRLSDDKTALLEMNGDVIIDYGEYIAWWSFWGSFIKVRKDSCYGLLDLDLKIALPCQYTNIFECLDGPHRDCYGTKQSRNDRWRYLDNKTLHLIP